MKKFIEAFNLKSAKIREVLQRIFFPVENQNTALELIDLYVTLALATVVRSLTESYG